MTHIDPTTTMGRAVSLAKQTQRTPMEKTNRRRQVQAHLLFAVIYCLALAVVLAPRSIWLSF